MIALEHRLNIYVNGLYYSIEIILYPVLELVDGYNVNYGIVSGFIFLQAMNNIDEPKQEIITEKMNGTEEKKDDSNNIISMQDLHKIETESKSELKHDMETSESSITFDQIQLIEISMQK